MPAISTQLPRRLIASLANPRHAWAWILLIACGYLLLSLEQLATQEIEKDEFITARLVRTVPLAELPAERFHHGHPPLYFILVKIWINAVGYSQSNLILFSVLTGLLGLPLFYLLARELDLGAWSIAAPFVWAFHPSFFFFAHFVRPYIGLLVLTVAIMVLLYRALRVRAAWPCLLLGLLGVVGASWNHLLAMLWGSALIGLLAIPPLRRAAPRALWLALCWGLIVHGAIALVTRHYVEDNDPLEWVLPTTIGEAFDVILKVIGGRQLKYTDLNYFWILPIFAVLAFAVWTIRDLRALKALSRESVTAGDPPLTHVRWLWLAALTLIPLLSMIVVSIIFRPVIIERYMLLMLPGFAFFMLRAVAAIPSRLWATIAVFGLSYVMIRHSKRVIRERETGLRWAVQEIEQRLQPGDGIIVFTNISEEALLLYGTRPHDFHHEGRPTRTLSFMRELRPYLEKHPRVWVIVYKERSGIIKTPEWRATFKPFYQDHEEKTVLFGLEVAAR